MGSVVGFGILFPSLAKADTQEDVQKTENVQDTPEEAPNESVLSIQENDQIKQLSPTEVKETDKPTVTSDDSTNDQQVDMSNDTEADKGMVEQPSSTSQAEAPVEMTVEPVVVKATINNDQTTEAIENISTEAIERAQAESPDYSTQNATQDSSEDTQEQVETSVAAPDQAQQSFEAAPETAEKATQSRVAFRVASMRAATQSVVNDTPDAKIEQEIQKYIKSGVLTNADVSTTPDRKSVV